MLLTGPQLSVQQDVTVKQLNALLNQLLTNDETLPYSFFIEDQELTSSVGEHLQKNKVLHACLKPNANHSSETFCTEQDTGSQYILLLHTDLHSIHASLFSLATSEASFFSPYLYLGL